MRNTTSFILLVFLLCTACREDDELKPLRLVSAFAGATELPLDGMATSIPPDRSIALEFSSSLNASTISSGIILKADGQVIAADINLVSERSVVIVPGGTLQSNTIHVIEVTSALRGSSGQTAEPATISFQTAVSPLFIVSGEIGEKQLEIQGRNLDIPLDLQMTITFSDAINPNTFLNEITLAGPVNPVLSATYSNDDRTVTLTSGSPLRHLSRYELKISSELRGANGQPFDAVELELYTAKPSTPQLPVISDDALLTLVQQQTFKYFWDFAHPSSGMARERNTSGDLVTTGGSGFGIMTIPVGIERGFITRQEGLDRLGKILTFLETADRFHGAWPHWLNGNTGDVIPFSPNDNGGDLVETSFLIQGLLTFREYLNSSNTTEKELIDRINVLWRSVEWDWYTRGENVLYWHWSPDKEWAMNMPIRGYNEALITYILAASSPTHSIDADVYHEGWARGGVITNDEEYYGTRLPVGPELGGPLFFAHYSFLGLDPRGLEDSYADYHLQNVNHSLINHAYSADNPRNYAGYSDESWGLTASDNQNGYSAHSPTNDLGVITPTAALSSFPYTPEQSMKALKFFYYSLGDRLWGPYGFYDAFNITEGWVADSYLAIDQGPIVIMIENYRTGLLWDLFMSTPELGPGLDKLGFTR